MAAVSLFRSTRMSRGSEASTSGSRHPQRQGHDERERRITEVVNLLADGIKQRPTP